MKKCLLAAVLVFVGFASSLFSLEWGGVINNMTNASTSDFKNFPINQSNGISLWLKSSLNEDKSLNISTEAMYRYNLLINDGKTVFSNVVDLNLLMLSGNWAIGRNNLYLDVGRFPYSDLSSFVFSQKSDGISLRFGNMEWNTGLYAGYTGLLNRFTVGMSDLLDKQLMDQFYDLCYGYVPVIADFAFTNLKGNNIALQAGYFLDISTGKRSKALFEISANGSLGNVASYTASVAALSENFKNLMLFGNLDFSFYISNMFIAGVGVDYTSGDHGFISFFNPITYKPIHNSQSVIYGADVIAPKLSAILVLGDLCLTANEKVVTSLPRKGFTLNGLDTSVSAVYNIFSDLQVGCTLNAYADIVSSDYNNFSVTLNAGLAF